jgi:hypothetical protein
MPLTYVIFYPSTTLLSEHYPYELSRWKTYCFLASGNQRTLEVKDVKQICPWTRGGKCSIILCITRLSWGRLCCSAGGEQLVRDVHKRAAVMAQYKFGAVRRSEGLVLPNRQTDTLSLPPNYLTQGVRGGGWGHPYLSSRSGERQPTYLYTPRFVSFLYPLCLSTFPLCGVCLFLFCQYALLVMSMYYTCYFDPFATRKVNTKLVKPFPFTGSTSFVAVFQFFNHIVHFQKLDYV